MKPILPLLAGVAVIAAAISLSFPPVQAQQAGTPAAGELPVGLRCVVALDPRAERILGPVSDSLKKTGLTSEGTVEGTLLSLGVEWVVLKDGSYENWIPRDKVLSLRVSR